MSGSPKQFHKDLEDRIDAFVHSIYDITGAFPKDELFGATSQARRAALSVALNYTEGNARHSKKEFSRFLKIAYGSLKELLYLVRFAHQRSWIESDIRQDLESQGSKIGAMLWSVFSR